MSRSACVAAVLGTVAGLLLAATPAPAATFVVNTAGDAGDGECGDGSCTLRDALFENELNDNQATTRDVITFDLPGVEAVTILLASTSLDPIGESVEVDGTSHTGGIVVDGSAVGASGHGIAIHSATQVVLRGLRVTGFAGQPGIGTSAAFRITGDGAANHILDDVAADDTNSLMHGVAILDADFTQIRDSAFVGLDRSGITVRDGAADTTIEGTVVAANAQGGVHVEGGVAPVERTTLSGNAVLSNTDGGVFTLGDEATTILTGNAIQANGHLGIDHDHDDEIEPIDIDLPGAFRGQNPPQLTGVAGGTVSGRLTSAPDSTYRIELFGSPACHPAGVGDGAVLLGSENVQTGSAGTAGFTIVPPSLPALDPVLTATATRTSPAGGGTSEFSACLDTRDGGGPPPGNGGGGSGSSSAPPATTPSPPSGGSPFVPFQPPPPVPVPGEQVVGSVRRGIVVVRLPDGTRFELQDGQAVPFGAQVDTREGRVEIVAAGTGGAVYRADFFDGVFTLSQLRGGIVQLRLTERLAPCGKTKRARSSQRRARPRKRRLWGDGRGRFRVVGSHSAATVRGTEWLVQDTCKGTLTRVKEGVVDVRDFRRRRTIRLRAPRSYLAKPRRGA